MRMNKRYYELPTVRNLRGKLRRKSRKFRLEMKMEGCKASISYKDHNNADIFRTRRYKGRIRIGYIMPVELVRASC